MRILYVQVVRSLGTMPNTCIIRCIHTNLDEWVGNTEVEEALVEPDYALSIHTLQEPSNEVYQRYFLNI
jgi:hypothetical protein